MQNRTLTLSFALLSASSLCPAQSATHEIYNTGGIVASMEATTASGTEAKLTGAIDRWQAQLGGLRQKGAPNTRSGPGGTYSAVTAQFGQDQPDVMHAFVASDTSQEVCHVRMVLTGYARTSFQQALQRCASALKRSAPVGGEAAATTHGKGSSGTGSIPANPSTAHPQTPVGRPNHFPENWKGVAGVYFESTTGFGYGGMVIIDYIPVVLFKDGSYFEVGKMPLEDTDLAAERTLRPRRFGRWTRSGNTFSLDSGKGPHAMPLQGGAFFQAFTAEQGGALKGQYKRTSGGGNSAVGGEIGILTQSQYTFSPDGHFVSGSSMAALGSGAQSGVGIAGGATHRSPGIGGYTLSSHTVVFTDADGQQERRFFAYGSAHSPAQLDRDLVFFGDDVYVREEPEHRR